MVPMAQALDICIRGGGIVGRSLALLLAQEKLRVGLVDTPPESSKDKAADVRAYALNLASRQLLESLRCWPDTQSATPVLRMQVQSEPDGLVQFDAAQIGVAALTWIVDVPALEALLADAVRFQTQIQVLDKPAAAALTVVCEGKFSSTRSELGVDFAVTPYDQHAIAARISCQSPHGQVARQWFSKGEILAFLPLDGESGNSVAIVWSVKPGHATQLMNLSPQDFCQELQNASQQSLGTLKLISERKLWPLQKALALKWTGRSAVAGAWALAGDAAHNVHPLAGQGLNMGLADVAELARVIRQREYWRPLGDDKLLRRYERSRKAGMLPMATGGDGLQWLFGQNNGALSRLRNWGMNRIDHSGRLKHWLARQAMDF
jgi:2-polyprenyl-6-methoxyphenol hydroxylase-like FAD-dependent oxidoreductase